MRQLAQSSSITAEEYSCRPSRHSDLLPAQDGFAAHVAAEQFVDIANGEDVGIEKQRPSFKAKKSRDHAAQWRE